MDGYHVHWNGTSESNSRNIMTVYKNERCGMSSYQCEYTIGLAIALFRYGIMSTTLK